MEIRFFYETDALIVIAKMLFAYNACTFFVFVSQNSLENMSIE